MALLNVPRPVYMRCVKRAAERLGGYAQLAEHLGVSAALVQRWGKGIGMPPNDLFLRIVDLILDDGIHRLDAGEQRDGKLPEQHGDA